MPTNLVYFQDNYFRHFKLGSSSSRVTKALDLLFKRYVAQSSQVYYRRQFTKEIKKYWLTFCMLARFKSSCVSMLKQDKFARLIFLQGHIFGPLNISKTEMFPTGFNYNKNKQKCVFWGLKVLMEQCVLETNAGKQQS
jgi:hypothetical protein